MRIGTLSSQMMPKAATSQQREAGPAEVSQSANQKQKLKESIQQQIMKIKNAQANTDSNNERVKRLIGKFKSGMLLTPEEMAYILRHAPGEYEQINRVLRNREMYTQLMRASPTKADVQLTVLQAAKQIEKYSLPEDRELLAKHLANAKREYEKTDEYREKPDDLSDLMKKGAKSRQKKDTTQRMQYIVKSYESITSLKESKKRTNDMD